MKIKNIFISKTIGFNQFSIKKINLISNLQKIFYNYELINGGRDKN